MNTTHTATLYRRSGATTEDTQGRETQAWGAPALATDVPCRLQMLAGSMEYLEQGRDLQGTALLLVSPDALPAGVDVRPGDAWVITSGRSPFTTFLVDDVNPVGERGEGWEDECVVSQIEEAVP